jgi:hypothetical protein
MTVLTPDHLAAIIELALYRVSDRLKRGDPADVRAAAALRAVGEEMAKIMAEAKTG